MVWFIHFESFEVVCFRQMNIFRYFHYSDSNFHCISYFIFFSSIFNTLKKNQALKIQKQNYVTYSLINFQVML